MACEIHTLYNPIIGAGENHAGGHEPVDTPDWMLERVAKFQATFQELKVDLMEEVNMVDVRIIKPATDGKEYLSPMKKVIKKRQDRKVRRQTRRLQDMAHMA